MNKVSRRLADTSRVADRIGFRAQVGLDEGLERLVTWWRAEQDAATAAALAGAS